MECATCRSVGPALICSRKGFKAGTIQLFALEADEPPFCFISEVSGAIRPRTTHEMGDGDLAFLRYYIARQVKSQVQLKDNRAQLNNSKLESIVLGLPDTHSAIGSYLRERHL